MEQKIRLIALDLDGTTLNSKKELTERTRQAIVQAAKSGIRILAATGRTFSSLAPEILKMSEISCAITSNGAVVNRTPDGQILYENCLTPKSVTEMTEKIRKEAVDTEVCSGGQAYIGKEYYDRILQGKTQRDIAYVRSTRHPVADIYDFLLEHSSEIENINLNFKDLEEKQRWLKQMQSNPDVTPTSSFLYNVELGGRDTSKGHALAYLMDQWNLDARQVMAFGDSENDLDMIEMAGIGVAMANAVEVVRERADRITDSNDQDGVAKVIEELLEGSV